MTRRGPTEKIPPPLAGPSTDGPAEIVIVSGDGSGRTLALPEGKPLVVGGGPGCDLFLGDATVSARHAEICWNEGSLQVRDLDSTNGTRVNGALVREALALPGSRIDLGRTVLVLATRSSEGRADTGRLARAEEFGELVGRSEVMRDLFGLLERLSRTDVSVLLTGETGTGKELAARGIHAASQRARGPFVVVDCGRLQAELFDSELQGHRRGSFTGAVQDRPGAFRSAEGGTLFLDEVGELPLELQPKLLRVLEQREVTPLGTHRPLPVDVRIVAATHRDLLARVAEGAFREDLYFRLAVAPVWLPPLRERREDLPLLCERLLSRTGGPSLSAEATAVLHGQEWRGNVRELRNVLERASALSTSGTLQPRDLMLYRRRGEGHRLSGGQAPLAGRTLLDLEREAIRETLHATGGNRSAAARLLGVARSSLLEKMRRHGLR